MTLLNETLAAQARAERNGNSNTASALAGIAAMIAALEDQARELQTAPRESKERSARDADNRLPTSADVSHAMRYRSAPARMTGDH